MVGVNKNKQTIQKNQAVDGQPPARKHKDPDYEAIKQLFCSNIKLLLSDCIGKLHIPVAEVDDLTLHEALYGHQLQLLDCLQRELESLLRSFISGISKSFNRFWTSGGQISIASPKHAAVSGFVHDAVEEEYFITLMTSHCEFIFDEELQLVTNKFARLLGNDEITAEQIPVSPVQVTGILCKLMQHMELTLPERMTVFQLYETQLLKLLGLVYQEIIDRYGCRGLVGDEHDFKAETSGIVVELIEENEDDDYDDAAINSQFLVFRDRLENWRQQHAPSPYNKIPASGNSPYDLFEVRNSIAQMGQQSEHENAHPLGMCFKPLKWKVLESLAANEAEGVNYALSAEQEDVLDLVSLIFKSVHEDIRIPDELKVDIMALEYTLAQVALKHKSFFIDHDYPIRRLVEEICQAACFLNCEDYFESLIGSQCRQVIKNIIKDESQKPEVYQRMLDEFLSVSEKNDRRSAILEDRVCQLTIKKEKMEQGKMVVMQLIESSLNKTHVPKNIAIFLLEVWRNFLLYAYFRQSDKQDLWKNAVATMQNLIITITPPANEQQRRQRLKLLPNLVKQLRFGLKKIAYEKRAQARFFKELAVHHIVLMNKNTLSNNPDFAVEAMLAEFGNEPEKVFADSGVNALTDEQGLARWLLFERNHAKIWGKLIWQSKLTKNMLFVSRAGAKLFEMQAETLAEEIQQNKVKLLEENNANLIEKVLATL